MAQNARKKELNGYELERKWILCPVGSEMNWSTLDCVIINDKLRSQGVKLVMVTLCWEEKVGF